MIRNADIESFLFKSNARYLFELYDRFLVDQSSVDESWQNFFQNMHDTHPEIASELMGASWSESSDEKIIGVVTEHDLKEDSLTCDSTSESLSSFLLVEEFRYNGHLLASLDPLELEPKETAESLRLDPKFYGFDENDLEKQVKIGKEHLKGVDSIKLKDLIAKLKEIYCSTIGYEFSHIHSTKEKDWLYSQVEQMPVKRSELSKDKKIKLLTDLVKTEGMESFLHSRFPGAKRFSVEGGESTLVAIDEAVNEAVTNGVEELVLGMPHRGRLNVLTRIFDKSYESIFAEFRGNIDMGKDVNVSGDVKYHAGKSTDKEYNGKKIHLSLTANPSHLEAVNSVVVGKVRAKQDLKKDLDRSKVMGILLHGDAAFAGQGVVAETLILGALDGYETGGTFNIVVNNQVGFTTSAKNARVSRYCTDIAKSIQAPIIHVNGDDVESVYLVTRLAESYRNKFKKDIVVDICCYRKYGHNEGDEPMFTQPIMYKKIKEKKSPSDLYASFLIDSGVISENDYTKIKKDFNDFLNSEYEKSENYQKGKAEWLKGKWSGLSSNFDRVAETTEKTGVKKSILETLGKAISEFPDGFKINSKVKRLLDGKKEMFKSGKGFDWATAEMLAYGTLLCEGHKVRLSGQDARRGTFSHRHSVLIDQNSEDEYIPVNNINDSQAKFEAIDSNLSEFAVLGFEYGYSNVDPNALTIWEAQFGDFSNGAQIIIDQFIASAEVKWLRMCGLVMLLPHGFEGQGPEHSSARLERYLQLCAENNMQVVNCTTPANFFHVLRKQIHRDYRVPLIVMSPKSLLRHPKVISSIDEFTEKSKFQTVIKEQSKILPSKDVKRIILTSGKVYYDLLEYREKNKIKDTAILRLEQYYPFPRKDLMDALREYKNAVFVWCQEEPKNSGAWKYLYHYYENVLEDIGVKNSRPIYAGRPKTASPASGFLRVHLKEQEKLLDDAFNKKLRR